MRGIEYSSCADGSSRRTLARITELWRFREVLKNFVAQDLKVRYRRSALGFFWSLLNPLLQMGVISVVFSLILRWNFNRFVLYLLCGLVPWSFFAASLDGCSMSIVSAESMVKRQYFPKLVFPLSLVLYNLITAVLSLFVLLLVLGPFTGFHWSRALAVLPLSLLCLFCFTLGLGAIAAVTTVHFRDMQHLISVFISAWFYLTPIIYPLDAGGQPSPIPAAYHTYFKLNPMVAILRMFHRPMFESVYPPPLEIVAAVGVALVVLVIGLRIFWRYEDSLIFTL